MSLEFTDSSKAAPAVTVAPTSPGNTLPSKYYKDPDIFSRELEAFFFSKWVCVGRADEIPTLGDYFLRDIAGESVIVVRDEAGGIRAFYNVCRHRGTRLSEKPTGCFKSRIRCPYHAWTFDLSGNLVAATHMESASFKFADFPLHAVHCLQWDGHIFVNLSKGSVAPLAEQLGPLVAKFRPWHMEDLRLGKRVVYDIRANWKLIVQNFSECLHCPMIHPALARLSHYLTGDNEPPTPHFLGGSMDLNPGVTTMTMNGKTDRAVLPHLTEKELRHVYYYWIAPNLLLSLHPDYIVTYTLWPKSPSQTEVICEFHFHRDEITREGFSPEDAFEFWDLTNRQDWHVSELSQLGISSRGYVPGPYSQREGLLHDLDRLVLAELTKSKSEATV
jgi:Rieske 2Fe-2S family protein